VFQFTLNGEAVSVSAEQNLLEFLREDARLISVKNGCSEGTCGSCTVLIDGRAWRACKLNVSKLDGKTVTTVEGLSAREKEVYSWAFGKVGAVQCGFCIPGIVMSAKALLDRNTTPTQAEVKDAIENNLCRCTGYVKIEQAILLAAKTFRDGVTPDEEESVRVGARAVRPDASEKVLGAGEFVDDLQVPEMLHGAVLRAKYPRAVVKKIDISAARNCPGVEVVLTAKDVPGERVLGHIVHDWPVMIAEGEETRYVGDALVILAATTKKTARRALELIQVEYEELTPLITPQAAMAEGAPRLHPQGNLLSETIVKRGDADKAIAAAKHVITQRYSTPHQEHAFMEPESALAVPSRCGSLTVYTAGQSVYDDHRGIVRMLGVAGDKVRIISKYVGGGFGGKEDLSVQHHAALLAWHSGRPVKLTLSRQESFAVHPKRHPMDMECTTACDADGKIMGVKVRIVADTGAYASLGGPVLQRACTHAGGPYQIDHVDIEGRAFYTNNPPSGAFRGFGVMQTCFAMESNLNLMAAKIGISPWEIRFRNAIEPGGVLSNGQIADAGTALKETLLAVKEVIDAHPDAGISCAFKNSGLGVGVPDIGRVKLKVQDGVVVICTSAACMGQGIATVVLQIVAEATGLPRSAIRVHTPDTMVTPDSGTTTASRQTLVTGEAARRAAVALYQDLSDRPLAELEGREYYREFEAVTDPMTSDKPNRVSHIAYAYATQVVILDTEGRVKRVVAAHDVGRVINLNGVEGQIEGGVVMGLGYALTEEFPLSNGVPTASFSTLGLMRSTQVPEIECIIIEKNPSGLAYGAKGMGEIVCVATPPAVAGAFFRRDGKLRNNLPLQETPYSADAAALREFRAQKERLRQSQNLS
jgi:selenium-dependent xanthine dehydrogenase